MDEDTPLPKQAMHQVERVEYTWICGLTSSAITGLAVEAFTPE
jgi:hypothetical protein